MTALASGSVPAGRPAHPTARVRTTADNACFARVAITSPVETRGTLPAGPPRDAEEPEVPDTIIAAGARRSTVRRRFPRHPRTWGAHCGPRSQDGTRCVPYVL